MENVKQFCEFQVKRNAARLSRGLLVTLEDMQARHKLNQKKLLETLPTEYHNNVKMLDTVTDEQMALLRKRILDNTNDHVRDILSDLENYQIEFNFKPKG